jgi:DNA-binding response OmpR family regulator
MIVIIDERPAVTEAYRASFDREGFSATGFTPPDFDGWLECAGSPELAAIEAYVLGEFDCRSGVAQVLRSRSAAPAIALTETPSLASVLALYAAGIDDVVRKPCHARELIARFAAIRRRGEVHDAAIAVGPLLVHGDGRDPEIDGVALVLPRRERRILEYLAANRGRRVTRSQIFNAVYGLFDEEIEESVVESHISKLRKKLRRILGFDPIDTRRYLGYHLAGLDAAKAA